MNIWEMDKLLIFIVFVIPGFIALKIYELLNPTQLKDSSKQLIDAVTYSSINYAVLLLPIYWIEASNLKTCLTSLYVIFYFFVLFICPVFIAFLWDWIRKRDFVQKKIPHPTQKPWDWIFSQKKHYWIKVKMKDGEIIGGLYAENSFTSSAPAEEQIYLQETWIINDNGGFDRVKENSEGVIMLSSEIKFIELIRCGD